MMRGTVEFEGAGLSPATLCVGAESTEVLGPAKLEAVTATLTVSPTSLDVSV